MKDPRDTECSCDLCQIGCRTMPGYLEPDDLQNFDIKDLCASDGAIVFNRQTGEVQRIPTLVPQQRGDGCCVFFDSDHGICKVHETKPFGCRAYSACDDDCDTTRSAWVLQQITESDEYQRRVRAVAALGQIARDGRKERYYVELERVKQELND